MKHVHFVVAPDSFKESMSAAQAAQAIERGLQSAYAHDLPALKVTKVPLADGGEGTMAVIAQALGAQEMSCQVMGPLGEQRIAHYSYSEARQLAIIEVARACGLDLVPNDARNPLMTTTYGVGQLVQAALDQGAKKILFALGGSATNDCGVGMLAALGATFLNHEGVAFTPFNGADLGLISQVDLSAVHARLAGVELEVACDVENPLIGPFGASHVFAKQKGATPEMIQLLESYMKQFVPLLEVASAQPLATIAKTGAAGGLGASLLALHARMQSGIDLLLTILAFEQLVKTADYVITGEGSIDAQTVNGKTISGVARCAHKYGVPVIALAGRVGDDCEGLYPLGVSAIIGIVDGAKPLAQALAEGEQSVCKSAEQIGRLIQIASREKKA